MTILVDAVYQDGILKPVQPVALPNGIQVKLFIEAIESSSALIQFEDPLAGVVGIDDGPIQGDVANRHDDYLYGRQ